MVIHERSVTSFYVNVMLEYMMRRLQTNRFSTVGKTGVTHIHGGDCTRSYAIVVNGTPVAWLYLGRRPTWAAWEVRQVYVFPELRGHGLAHRIYRAAVNVDKIILASGKSQSKSSRVLWQRFIERDTFRIWAHDFNNLALKSGVEYHDGELFCALPVYQPYPSRHDVRFLAVRR